MVIDQIKFNIAGDFIQVIQQDFLYKNAAHKVGKYNIKYNYHDHDHFYRMIVKKIN